MKKEERLAYMRKRFPQLEEERCDIVAPVTETDIKEEAVQMETFGEYNEVSKENVINSDEI